MVARINTSKSILRSLNYNEKKVQQGKAAILAAAGFFKHPERLKFHEKLQRFESYTCLNRRAVTNCLHVSLNFDVTEKLDNEKMETIASAYMEKIGFGAQPYLVYRHLDAGHPHLHIVSTNIQKDGSRISMHLLGANQSEKARKEIEQEFHLVVAGEKRILADQQLLKAISKITRDTSGIKRAVSNILTVVLNQYKYCTLPELNAVLGLYNVRAERGSPGSRIFEKKGLVYVPLDDNGNKAFPPMKASLFYMRPTLKFLEQKFTENNSLKDQYKKSLVDRISWVMTKSPGNLESFRKLLEQEGISLVVRRGKEEVVFGLTYVDHKSKVVYNGSDLGQRFSAKAILEGFEQDAPVAKKKTATHFHLKFATPGLLEEIRSGVWKIGPLLPEASMPYDPVPYSFKIKKRKKRRKSIS